MKHPLRCGSAQARPEGDRVSIYDRVRQTTHSLNRTAALVWLRSDGATSMEELRRALEMEVGVATTDSEAVLLATLAELEKQGLMENRVIGAQRVFTRRELLRVMNLAGVSALVLPSVVLTACVDAADVTGIALTPGDANRADGPSPTGLTTAGPTTTTTTAAPGPTTSTTTTTTAAPGPTTSTTTTTAAPGPTTSTTTTTAAPGPTTAPPTTTSGPTTTPVPPTTAPPTTPGPTTTPIPPTTAPPTTPGPTTTPVPPTTAPPTTTTTTLPPTTPPPTGVTIEEILAEVYHAVLAGTLEGVGRGRRGGAKLLAWKGFLIAAKRQLDHGRTAPACALLRVAYVRADGDRRPRDFVEGPAVPTIAAMIATLRNQLGCPPV